METAPDTLAIGGGGPARRTIVILLTVAALVAVLAAASGGAGEEAAGPASQWADHGRAVRGAATHGRGAWRASAQPR